MTTPQPFRIAVAQAELDDLHDRLDRTRWPHPLAGPDWSRGVPVDHLRALAAHWRHGYDWRAHEARLNRWPQWTTEIDGTRIHFAHVRSQDPDAPALMLIHGWPGSFVEFLDLAERLPEFHLVIPSLPGFGFSGPTPDEGWEPERIADAFAALLSGLGYERFGVQGGDWGAAVARELGRRHTDRVLGVHLNLLPASAQATAPEEDELAALSADERERTLASWRRTQEWTSEQEGYASLQSTRPQTLSYALNDSPVGQLAWIEEKFRAWSDEPVDRDLLLTNVTLYWLTGTAGSAANVYYERAHADYWGGPPKPSTAPTALADFPRENFIPLRHIAERTNRIVRWTSFDRGGHFAALEQPDALAGDVRAFFAGR